MKRNNIVFVALSFLFSFLVGFGHVNADEVNVHDIQCFYKPTTNKRCNNPLDAPYCNSAKHLFIDRNDEGTGVDAKCPTTVYISSPRWSECGYSDNDTATPCLITSNSVYHVKSGTIGGGDYIEFTLEYSIIEEHTEEQDNYGDALPIDCGEYKHCYTNLEFCMQPSYSFNIVLTGGDKNAVELGKAKITVRGKE